MNVIKNVLENFRATSTAVQLIFSFVAVIVFTFSRTSDPYRRFKRISRPWPFSWLPIPIVFSVDSYVQKGYDEVIKRHDVPFTMKWWGLDYLFMPPKYLNDLKRAAFEDLSFFQNISYAFSLQASAGDIYSSTVMIDVVKRKLNPLLPVLVPVLAEERDFAFGKVFGDTLEWRKFNATKMCAELMQRTTCSVLMCKELSRNDEFIKKSLAFGESLFGNAVLQSLLGAGLFRKQIVWFGSFLHRKKMNELLDMVTPIVAKRMQARAEKDDVPELDALEWTIELGKMDPKEASPRRMASQLIHNLFAGTGAPASTVAQILFSILMEPGYLEPLRTEAEEAFKIFGVTEKALNSMPLMDSFIMETNRVHPAGCITAARTVMSRPFQFHDGLVLPVGTRIAFPTGAIQTDPDNFNGADQFDGRRFMPLMAKVKAEDEPSKVLSAATVSTTNLAYGYGKHACVGRFYTVRKVKLIVAKMLLEYDFKWEQESTQRPKSFAIMGQFAPNLEKTILVRKRQGHL